MTPDGQSQLTNVDFGNLERIEVLLGSSSSLYGNASGGVLSSDPIGASGTLRMAEAALQVRGQAGEHQVDGARLALAHALGGASQFFAMWVVSSEKP